MGHWVKKFTLLILFSTFCLLAFTPPHQTDPGHKRAKTQARPVLSGPTVSHGTGHFLIHYTRQGEDAVSPLDDDHDGLPDFVQAVAEALEFSWQQEVEQQGWRLPLPDKGEGGDSRFDVYLQNHNDLFGYVETYGGYVGDNPATIASETNSAYGYLSLDNDYQLDDLGDLSPLEAMQTTVAHELHHAIQAAYDDIDPYEWLYEASAVWVEDEVYPHIGDARSYLLDYMAAPDLCPLSVGRDDQDVRWYGGWILLRYIAEHHGGAQTIQRLWEQMAVQDGLPALEATLAEQGTTLTEVLVNFAIANLTKSNCPTNTPYCYSHGNDYLRPYVEGTVRVDAGEMDTLIPKDGVQQYGADYVRLKSDGPILVDFRGSEKAQWQVRLVGLDNGLATVMPLVVSGPTLIDVSKFDRLYLVIVNTTPVEAETDCCFSNYTLALADANAFQLITSPPVPDDPQPYIPPIYHEPGAYLLDEGTLLDADEVPFSPLSAGYLPPDYTLTHLFSHALPDLGEFASDYAPGGEPIITLEYGGSDSDTYLLIYQSPSPYPSVTEWVEAQGYSKNDVRLVNNKPIYLLDLSDEMGPFSTATFVHHNLFIVIDGTFDWLELQQVVAGFLANNP
ncbi:MAG: hypothetical protein JXM69_14665 [Anaerolineae bacterium]|nr:hypothetical protein [Anaerolineae bacterium]